MKIHLIGIGGIGVSALAQYYLAKGHEVSGSDLVASEITDFLRKKGVKIFIGNYAQNIQKDLDLIVYSPAVKPNNPEYKTAKKYKIKTQSYPEALGELTKEYYTIAVTGAHGKSTTTAMIALILTEAEMDPTVIVGTKVKEFGNNNFRAGKSKLLVIEACEYDASFLHYSPQIEVITNIDKEHLDYFKNFANVKKAFKNFILKLPEDGFLVFNENDKELADVVSKVVEPKFKLQSYSFESPDAKKIKSVLKIPGNHNVLNALGALEVARSLAIPDKISLKALAKFSGTWRRFEIIHEANKLKAKNYTLISDYGHHPNEIFATLNAAREKYPHKKIWCVFQPHQHQRTHYLFNDFVKVFCEVPTDKIIITDIYDVAGRETKKINKTISSKKLVEKINKEHFDAAQGEHIIYLPTDKIESFVKENIPENSVLIIMGAGDIYKLVDKF